MIIDLHFSHSVGNLALFLEGVVKNIQLWCSSTWMLNQQWMDENDITNWNYRTVAQVAQPTPASNAEFEIRVV
jgi:hypothetical protein